MLLALAEALQSRDAYSGAHWLRVAALAGTVGERLGWDEARLTRLRVGALLHDVGKLAIPKRILRKAGPLTSNELERIRFHPVAGARLVSALAPAHATLACALYHHERWDGDGYPLGRSGSRLPAAAGVPQREGIQRPLGREDGHLRYLLRPGLVELPAEVSADVEDVPRLHAELSLERDAEVGVDHARVAAHVDALDPARQGPGAPGRKRGAVPLPRVR